jgi:predicted MFS family arabinose efflux permease
MIVPPANRSGNYGWLLVALLWGAGLLNYLDRQVIFSLFPLIREDLGLTDMQLGWTSSSFLWVYAIASPLCGYAADRFGRVRLIVASLGLWSVVTFLTGRASSFEQLLTARAAMGLSEAFYLPAALALIAKHHGESTRGLATGLHYSGIYAGIVIGGAGGGWIGENYGWRFAFTLLGTIGVAYSLILARSLREGAMADAVDTPRESFRGGVVALLRIRAVWILMFVFVATSAANWLVYTWMPLYLFERFQLSLTRAGFLATFWIQIGSVAGILLGGLAADWWAKRDSRGRVWLQAFGLLAAAPFLFLSGFSASTVVVAGGLFVFGIGRGIFDANAMPVLCLFAPEQLRSTGFGLLNFAGVLAGGVMTTAAGYLKASIGLGQLVQAGGLFVLLASGAMFLLGRGLKRA